jgi:N-acetyl-anhydromuramyl-L-alanine amidase AmpD
MKLITDKSSPNKTAVAIEPSFVVIHYTATTLERTLEIFMDPARQASAHLVIDRDGTVYELVPCLDGKVERAWHAGKSNLEFRGQRFDGLNDHAVGIELVNPNGNVFAYTEAQYSAVAEAVRKLAETRPHLLEAGRIVGHGDIAGYRGKCDPGLCFDWTKLNRILSRRESAEPHAAVCTEAIAERLRGVYSALAGDAVRPGAAGFEFDRWPEALPGPACEALSSLLEQVCADLAGDTG